MPKKEKKNSLSCLLLFFSLFLSLHLCPFVFVCQNPITEGLTSTFFKAWDCVVEGGEALQDLFIQFDFFLPSSSTKTARFIFHLFNSSRFVLSLLFLMWVGGPENLPRSSRCVCPAHSHPPTHTSVSIVTFRCGSLTEQTGSGEMLS